MPIKMLYTFVLGLGLGIANTIILSTHATETRTR